MRVDFPDGFIWGAATAAHQVEGNNVHSDWWRAETLGTVKFPSGAACEQYTRYEADFDLARELGHNAHRLSIEWARIEPEPGVFDEAEIAHYVDVLKALKERGLTSFVTLHHFTNPVWFAERGGWTAHGAPELFERYVRRIVEPLAPYVDYWLTFNEPTTVPLEGYLMGEWPPHKRAALLSARRFIDTQAAAHILAYRAIHELVPGATVGYTVMFLNWRPLNPRSVWQRFLARRLERFSNYRFGDAVGEATDLIGLQYYVTLRLGLLPRLPGSIEGIPRSDMGWDIDAEGLYDVTLATWKRYGKPIYITENGVADAWDTRRESFIVTHLTELRRAMDAGADVRGYLYWSFLDNFEWAHGYAPRFGLVEVDYETQERTPRGSALAYRKIITENGFDTEQRA